MSTCELSQYHNLLIGCQTGILSLTNGNGTGTALRFGIGDLQRKDQESSICLHIVHIRVSVDIRLPLSALFSCPRRRAGSRKTMELLPVPQWKGGRLAQAVSAVVPWRNGRSNRPQI